jgi:hypothetical protein
MTLEETVQLVNNVSGRKQGIAETRRDNKITKARKPRFWIVSKAFASAAATSVVVPWSSVCFTEVALEAVASRADDMVKRETNWPAIAHAEVATS